MKLLALEPRDGVLEVGFAHGRTIERAAAMVPEGFVAGIDTSEEMVDMATRRCRRLIDAGRVRLALGDSARIPYPDAFFDKGLGIHTIYFWPDPAPHLRELRRVLRTGGRLVLGFRPNDDPAAADFPEVVYRFYATEEVLLLLQQTGFEDARTVSMGGGLTLVTGRRRAD